MPGVRLARVAASRCQDAHAGRPQAGKVIPQFPPIKRGAAHTKFACAPGRPAAYAPRERRDRSRPALLLDLYSTSALSIERAGDGAGTAVGAAGPVVGQAERNRTRTCLAPSTRRRRSTGDSVGAAESSGTLGSLL